MSPAAVGAPAKSAAAKKPRSYPTYHVMVTEAILALKERTGSSQVAIAKFIEEKQKKNLPANFKKLLLVQLKKLVANGKLVKVKNSFKLPPKTSSSSSGANPKPVAKKPAVAAAAKPKKKAEAKPKSVAVKRKVGDKPKPAKKAAKTAEKKSPGKKAAVAAAAAKKKVVKKTPVKVAKKPKSIKSPAKKGSAVKRAKK